MRAPVPFCLQISCRMRSISLFILLAVLLPAAVYAQSPTICPINAGPDQSVCVPNCATLTGTLVPTNQTTSYTTSQIPYAPDPFNVGTGVGLFDDQWSQVINLPFPFCFYGQVYTQCLIGSNGLISFNLAGAGGYCQWPITAAVPSTFNPMNTIMGPWQDLNPGVGGQIRYATYGAAPCRRFVVSWNNVPMYACGTPATQQIILYERTNIIDNFIQTKPLCASWNGGRAIQAIHNANGTAAVVQAGRNSPLQWTVTNEGRRYTPSGAPTYVAGWYNGVTYLGPGPSITVCPTVNTTYTYQATYTNCNNTTVTVSDQVNVTVSTLTLSQSQTNIICNGQCTGTASVSVVSGTGPFTYAWAPSGGNAATASALCAGTYTVTVTGAGGCQATATFNITQPPGMTAVQGQTNVLCNGQCNGTASVTISGGTGPYTYNWTPGNPPGDGTPNVTGLCAGSWSVTVTDANGCTITRTFNITQPPVLTATGGNTNVLCNGQCTGTATVTPAGGVTPYSYLWSPSGGNAATATGLCAGTYTATVTDANGCTATQVLTVTQPPAITAAVSSTPAMCGNINGTATVTPSGGTGPYTYSWAPQGGTGSTASNLPGGTYTCTITDANGCTLSQTVNVTSTPPITATITVVTPVSCSGGTNGSATVTPGGTSPYTYTWSPLGGNGATASNLPAGTYTVNIVDANGCATSATVNITQPAALTATGAQTNVLCNGVCSGSATVTPAGGTAPYTYAWAPAGGNGATATALCAGTYTATVTDANGCIITQTYTITQPTALSATSSSTVATCGNSNGSASIIVTGGTGPYTYSWAPSGGSAATANALAAGTYTCTVTDANGCVLTVTVVVPGSGLPTATISAFTNISCFGGSNGSATVTASGGTGPYTYAWTPAGGTGTTASGLPAGTYSVTVTDTYGCTASASVALTQPPVLTASASSTSVSCNGGTNASASVTAGGGTGTYSYNWAPSGGTGSTAIGLGAGTYTVTVTDANGCTATATATVTQPATLTATMGAPVNATCNGGANGSATVTPAGGTGPYTYVWAPNGGTGATGTALAAGSYTVTITDVNGCQTAASVTITQPAVVSGTTSAVQSTCGSANGSATVVPSGGTGPYTYAWAPSGGTAATATGLISGNYTVTITDANGCTGTATVNVPNAANPVATITASTNVTCFGAADGTASASASGGTGPYTWAWAPTGGTTANATALGPNTFTCTVTDANGCTATATVTITEPPALAASLVSQTDVLCFGGNTGAATVTVAGGTNPMTYAWAPSGGTAATATGLAAGTYTCTVTDANNCTTTQTVTITAPPQLTLAVAGFDATCSGACDGQVVVIPSGGTQPFSFLWNTGCTSPSCNNMCAGSYSITVTDANGCIASDSTAVNEPAVLVTATTATPATCSQQNGTATVTPSGGTGPYTYVWSPAGGTGATTTGLGAGTYTVVVTDANGCTATDSATIGSINSVVVAVTSTTDAACNGDCNGQATINIGGGTAPYTIAWPSGGNALTETGLCAGVYTVNVTDANNCPASATVTINQPLPLQVAVPTPAAICIGQSVTLSTVTSGGTPVYTEVWAPAGPVVSPTVTTTYTVTVTDANGCTIAPQTVTVTVNPPLNIVPSANASVCPGVTASLSAAASGGDGNYTYTWSPATSPATGPNVTATPASTTTYTVTVTDGCGTPAATDSVTITVLPSPTIIVSADNQVGCVPMCVTFTNLTSGISSCDWDFGDNTSDNSTCTPVHCYNTPGSYNITLQVTDGNGCVSTLILPNYITVNPNPVAEFTASPQPATILNPTIQFTDQSAGAVAWSWTFGDLTGSTSAIQNPAFTYADTGCFDVTLTVTNAFGCSSDTTHPVCIEDDFTLYIPNGFSPNDDGLNDIFLPQGHGIDPESFEMWIFDRWGNMIYYTDDLYKGWDGRANYGTDVSQQDTYVWKIKCKNNKGINLSYIGHISIVK